MFDCAFKPAKRQALDPLHGPHQDDGRGAAVHLRRDLARRSTCRRTRRSRTSSRPTSRPGGSAPRRSRSTATAASARSRSTRRRRQGRRRGRRRRRGGRGGVAEPGAAQAARRAAVDHAQVRHRRPRGLHHRRPLRGRHAGRDLPRRWPRKARRSRASPTRSRRRSRYALQYGVPLQVLVDKFSHVRFEPSGMTKNPEIRFAKSIIDYIFRWLATKFLSPEAQFRAGVNNRDEASTTPRAADARRRPPLAGAGHGERPPARSADDVAVRGDAEPGGRAAVLDVRVDHGAQRHLLQVHQLRHDERLRVAGRNARARGHEDTTSEQSREGAPAALFVFVWNPRVAPDHAEPS